MALVIGVTLYLTFGAFLILPHLDAPPIFPRMAIGLCASEFVAAVGWGMTYQECGGAVSGDAVLTAKCPALSGTFESAATLQIPVLTAAVLAVAAGYGLFVARRW
jgi:hypothetical protein